MKKLLSVFFIIAMLFSLASCFEKEAEAGPKIYKFTNESLDLSDFFYAYAPVAKTYEEFVSLEGSISNRIEGANPGDIFD